MEFSKKLMLVDPKLYRASMREKTLSRLDEDIEQTLNSELSDEEKATNYIAALRRYKYFGIPPKVEPKVDIESEILETVPAAYRHKAKRLMEHMKRDPSIQIGEKGELIHNQQKIEDSHLGDLLNEVIQKKPLQATPQELGVKGWEEFESALKGYNLSKDLSENLGRGTHRPKSKRLKHQQLPPPTPLAVAPASSKKKSAIAKSSRGRTLTMPKWLRI